VYVKESTYREVRLGYGGAIPAMKGDPHDPARSHPRRVIALACVLASALLPAEAAHARLGDLDPSTSRTSRWASWIRLARRQDRRDRRDGARAPGPRRLLAAGEMEGPEIHADAIATLLAAIRVSVCARTRRPLRAPNWPADRTFGRPRGSIHSPPMRLGTVLLTALLVLVAAAPADAAQRRVPQGWLGVTADGPFAAADAGEWDRMVAAGAESVRVAVRWQDLQPYRSGAVPPVEAARFRDVRGVPTDFSDLDTLISEAAAHRLEVLPVVQQPPTWAAMRPGDSASPPETPADVQRFLTTLVERYGPNGTLWSERPWLPRIPVSAWQIWNEPNLSGYWSEQPFARSYVRVLKAAARGVRRADPRATVLLAGFPNRSWAALRKVYAAGGRGHFDAVALHPYTARPANVLLLVRYARRVMRRNGDRALPLWITEFTWTASKRRIAEPVPFGTTDRGQARKLHRMLRLFASARRRARIDRVFWYTWISRESRKNSFSWSGLRRLNDGTVVDTPALRAFRGAARRLQGCAKGRQDARRCA
jgi:hypothetical protein